jgi:hypothetical protein
MDMLTVEVQPSEARLDELARWHGTDERNLPPAASLKNLARDTVTAIRELQQAREEIAELRAAMGQAFWAMEFRDMRTILLRALGPPPEAVPPDFDELPRTMRDGGHSSAS